MDRVHILLKQAHEYYDHWKKTVKEIQEAREGLRKAHADRDQPAIRYYTDLLALLHDEAAQDISMLKKCVKAAEELVSKLSPASIQNPGGEQGGPTSLCGGQVWDGSLLDWLKFPLKDKACSLLCSMAMGTQFCSGDRLLQFSWLTCHLSSVHAGSASKAVAKR